MANLKLENEITFSFNELAIELAKDPYPFYEKLLHAEEPVFAIDEMNHKILLLSRYDDVLKFLSLTNDISCDPNYLQNKTQRNYWDLFLLNTDGEEHILMRKILSKFFSPDRLNSIRFFINDYLPNLISAIDDHNEIDLIGHVAEALPLAVVGHIIGISNTVQLKEIRKWTLELNPLMDSFISKSAFSSSALNNNAMTLLATYSANLIKDKRKHPSDDLISYIISECTSTNICEEKMLANVIFMLIASHDTTVNMIGNGLFLLLKHPEQLIRLAETPQLSNYATDEILRFESPTQRASYRITKNITQIKNFEIQKNTQVILLLGAANRDPRVFENPNSFDITRQKNPHLAFGHGVHNCLGKALARLEGNLLFPALSEYLSRVKLKNREALWRKNTLFRIQENLIVDKKTG